ncbi:MAG: prepilin-type N-terminal cleavage/methylation domain-containing protein [Magnetococcus sp. WYHC-3]
MRHDAVSSLRQQGFTLIELIMVIAILGALSAIALPHFFSVEHEARVSSARRIAAAISESSLSNFGQCSANASSSSCLDMDDPLDVGGAIDCVHLARALTDDSVSLAQFSVAGTYGNGTRGTSDTNCTITHERFTAEENNSTVVTMKIYR